MKADESGMLVFIKAIRTINNGDSVITTSITHPVWVQNNEDLVINAVEFGLPLRHSNFLLDEKVYLQKEIDMSIFDGDIA